MKEALKYLQAGAIVPVDMETTILLVNALKEALAQPAQEPYGYDWSMLEAAQESLREHMARIHELEAALAQPEEEKLHPVHIGVDVTKEGTAVTAFYRKPDAVMEMFYSQFHPLAQPAQEPVARVTGVYGGRFTYDPINPAMILPIGMALYAGPLQREWVGLTDEERSKIWGGIIKYAPSEMRIKDFAQAIEAKLKEKNNGL